jgi:hypothetical protein
MIVHDMPQGSPEWFAVRRGIPTSSQFATIMAKGRTKGEPSKTRKTYLYKLAGERLTGEPMDSFSNGHMERGHTMEPEARQFYAFLQDAEPQLVGFITSGPKGCSPDSLIGADGMLEIKTKLPHLMLEAHERGEFPPEHRAQCQGQLWIAEREWVDLICYWPRMKPLIVRAYRDDAFIAELSAEVDRFNDELETLVAKYSPAELREAA